MILIYTHLSVVPTWEVTIIYILVMIEIIGRMIPAQSINTIDSRPNSRGAYMSITEAIKQITVGIGTVIAGLVVEQTTNSSPLQHFDTLGYLITGINLVSIILAYRTSMLVKK